MKSHAIKRCKALLIISFRIILASKETLRRVDAGWMMVNLHARLRRVAMKLLKALCVAIALMSPSAVLAHEAPILVVVLGEDSDRSAVSRNSEIYSRVVAELQ